MISRVKRRHIARRIALLIGEGILVVSSDGSVSLSEAAESVCGELAAVGWNLSEFLAATTAPVTVLDRATTERLRDAALERGCVMCMGPVDLDRFRKWITGHTGPFCSDRCKSKYYRLGLLELRRERD